MTTYSGNKGKRIKKRRTNPYCILFLICCGLLLASVLLNIKAVKLLNTSMNQTRQAISVAEDAQLIATQAVNKLKLQEYAEAELGYEYRCEDEQEAYVDYVAAEYLANVTWGEARGCSVTEQAAVMWCVLNRVDSPLYPDSVGEVVTQRAQFNGYSENNPITQEMLQLANSVLTYWSEGDDSGRVLPKEYLYFTGDGKHNYFYTTWASNAVAWDWSLPSPYKEATAK
jgi:hypothetical protein